MLTNSQNRFTYAWAILVVLFIGHVVSFGIRASFGAYISPWEQDFSTGRSLVSSISMLNFVIFAISQPLAGKLNDRFGRGIVPIIGVFLVGVSLILTSSADQLWKVFIFYGVLFSLGFSGCNNAVPSAIISNWFVKKRGFALGLIMSGFAVGQLVIVPSSLFLIETYGWRSTMLALGIIMIVVVAPLFIIFLRAKPGEKGRNPYGYIESPENSLEVPQDMQEKKESLPMFSVFKMKTFWQLTIPYFICGFTDVGIIQTHFVPIAEGKGFSLATIAIAFSLIAICNTGGTIVTGHLSDIVSRTKQLAIIYAFRALTYVLFIALNQPWLFMIFAVLYGIVEMASIAPTNSLAVQLFDKFSIGAILGMVTVSHNFGGAVGSWVPGLLFDLTGSYYSVFVLSIVLLLVGATIVLRIPETRIK